MKGNRIEKMIVVLLLISGVVISLIQFLYNRSLWLDEASLAINIIDRDFFELLKPLDHNQVAPILFLQIEKLFSLLWPNTEYGLRLFPLLCFWASIYFFYKIIKKQFNNSYTIIFALFFFVLNSTFIYYSSEAKQYMTDMFVLLSVFYFTLKDYKNEKNKLYILGISGIIAVFLSNVAPVILFTCGAYLIYEDFFITKKKKIAPLLTLFAVWLSVFSIYYYFFIYEHPTRNFMTHYWAFTLPAFLPLDSFHSFFSFLIDQKIVIQDLIFTRLTFFTYIMYLLLLTGIIGIVLQKKFHLLILFCTPILLHLFLSALWLYPFSYRLILYTVPCIIMLYTSGFNYVVVTGFTKLKIAKFCFISLLIPISFLYNLSKLPIQYENIKGSIKFIQENISENENIYIYSFAIPGYEYYNSIGFANTKNWHSVYSSRDINELNDLRGKTWLLFSHIADEDEEFMINYIDSLGHTKIKEFKTFGSSAYLYDFGE